jgi:hypothetical protein
VLDQRFVPHIRARGEDTAGLLRDPDWKPRHWVVETCHSWLNRDRGLLIRWSKKDENHLARAAATRQRTDRPGGAMRKYKRLRRHRTRARRFLADVARRQRNLFAHWRLGERPDGWTMGAQ